MLFSAIDDKQTVVRNVKNGVFKQANLYERGGELYAGMLGGFVRLMKDGRTSNPNVLWEDIECSFDAPTRVSGGLRYVEPHISN